MGDLRALDGVIWTDHPYWPTALRAIEENPRSITAGKYRVSLGTTHKDAEVDARK